MSYSQVRLSILMVRFLTKNLPLLKLRDIRNDLTIDEDQAYPEGVPLTLWAMSEYHTAQLWHSTRDAHTVTVQLLCSNLESNLTVFLCT